MLKVIKKNRLIVSPFTMRAIFLGLKARGKVYKKKAACFDIQKAGARGLGDCFCFR